MAKTSDLQKITAIGEASKGRSVFKVESSFTAAFDTQDKVTANLSLSNLSEWTDVHKVYLESDRLLSVKNFRKVLPYAPGLEPSGSGFMPLEVPVHNVDNMLFSTFDRWGERFVAGRNVFPEISKKTNAMHEMNKAVSKQVREGIKVKVISIEELGR